MSFRLKDALTKAVREKGVEVAQGEFTPIYSRRVALANSDRGPSTLDKMFRSKKQPYKPFMGMSGRCVHFDLVLDEATGLTSKRYCKNTVKAGWLCLFHNIAVFAVPRVRVPERTADEILVEKVILTDKRALAKVEREFNGVGRVRLQTVKGQTLKNEVHDDGLTSEEWNEFILAYQEESNV